MNDIKAFQIDSLGNEVGVEFVKEGESLLSLFSDGGFVYMAMLTLLLAAVFFAAWKAPAWVKEIGISTAVTGLLFSFFSAFQMFSVLQLVGDISPAVILGGLKCILIPSCYGLLVYLVSLVIRIVQKPRI